MRKALNDNPIAQIAMIGVLVVLAGFLVLGGMGKKSSEPTAEVTPATTTATGAPAPAVVDPATGAPAPAAVDPATGAPVPTTAPAAGIPTTGVPVDTGPPLPRRLDAAYRDGKTIVLLVTRGGGYDDRLLRGSVARLRSLPGIAVFTTRASGVARYARIAEAVNLDRVPALVVITPRDLSAGGAAAAQVLYGFQSTQTVVQAVRDILYRGPTVGYSPD